MKSLFVRFIPALVGLGLLPACSAQIQILTCSATAVPPIVRGEGISERVGDIVLNCSGGTPNQRITGNFSIFLNVNLTNRVVGNTVSGVVFTVDNGSGPQPVNVPGTTVGSGSLVYNGLSFTLSPAGSATLRLANLRAAAVQLMLAENSTIQAFLGFNSGGLVSLTTSQLTVGTVRRSLYAGNTSKLVCAPGGSGVPAAPSLAAFLAAGVTFTSVRVTEGFADALGPRTAWANLNADTGERIIVRYSGFPAGARLFAPDVVAGSDALQPTGAGDFGVPPSGGKYAPGGNGTLLLARVRDADSSGAGGVPVYLPGAPGSGPVSFDALSEIPLSNGAGSLVYEVVDADGSVLETAQFPVFLGLAPTAVNTPTVTGQDILLAPISTVMTGTAGDPLPRFAPYAAPDDCAIVGDCSSSYFPRMLVDTTPLSFTAQAGSAYQVAYARVLNQGGGVLRWSASVKYDAGSGWLRVSPDAGLNNTTLRIDALPGSLVPGVYSATVTVDGGPIAGAQSIPVSLTVTAATPAPVPVAAPAITTVMNAASLSAGPVAAGSLATIQGIHFAGKNLAVRFDGLLAKVLFSNDTQINVLVPVELSSKASTQLMVSADGIQSGPQTVQLAPFAPAIFKGGVLNQDSSGNGAQNPAAGGSVIQVFATGLPASGQITARIHDRWIDAPYWAGPAPGLDGVQQVDITVPEDLPTMTTDVYVCGGLADQRVCSAASPVTIRNVAP